MPAEREREEKEKTLRRQHEITVHTKSASDNLEWRRSTDLKFRRSVLFDGWPLDRFLLISENTRVCVCAHNIIIKGERGESTVGGTITGSLSQEAAAAALWLAAYARDCRHWMAAGAACLLTDYLFCPKAGLRSDLNAAQITPLAGDEEEPLENFSSAEETLTSEFLENGERQKSIG
jgi:hypothetical protein